MFRRGLTGVAWLLGLAVVTYEDVVAPIAHAAFGDRVIHERVHDVEPEAVQDLSTALIAPGQGHNLSWVDAEAGRSVEAWDVARVMVVQNVVARTAAEACGDRAAVVARGLEGVRPGHRTHRLLSFVVSAG